MPEQNAERRITHSVPVDVAPQRIDRYLAALAELELSRTKVQQLLDEGLILVDDATVPSRYQVQGGEVISITIAAPPPSRMLPENIPLDIVYQDEHLAVINKPAGMVTHPAPGSPTGTLVNALLHHFGKLPAGGAEDRPGIVHRLDKDTTGLLLVAKNEQAHRALQAAIAAREVKRSYLALIWGHMVDDEGTIDAPLARSIKDRKKMAVAAEGREAVTHYRVRERFRSYDLLDIDLQTGRTHQIRVHFTHVGHPVFGDPEYGGRDKAVRGLFAPERALAKRMLSLLPRQALHAQAIQFVHPVTGKPMEFSVDPPADFQQILDLLLKLGY